MDDICTKISAKNHEEWFLNEMKRVRGLEEDCRRLPLLPEYRIFLYYSLFLTVGRYYFKKCEM